MRQCDCIRFASAIREILYGPSSDQIEVYSKTPTDLSGFISRKRIKLVLIRQKVNCPCAISRLHDSRCLWRKLKRFCLWSMDVQYRAHFFVKQSLVLLYWHCAVKIITWPYGRMTLEERELCCVRQLHILLLPVMANCIGMLCYIGRYFSECQLGDSFPNVQLCISSCWPLQPSGVGFIPGITEGESKC